MNNRKVNRWKFSLESLKIPSNFLIAFQSVFATWMVFLCEPKGIIKAGFSFHQKDPSKGIFSLSIK